MQASFFEAEREAHPPPFCRPDDLHNEADVEQIFPVCYYVLTNGTLTRLYRWDVNEPLIELAFAEIQEGDAKFTQLIERLSPVAFAAPAAELLPQDTHLLRKRPLEYINATFARL